MSVTGVGVAIATDGAVDRRHAHAARRPAAPARHRQEIDTYAGLGLDRGLAVGLRAQLAAIERLPRHHHHVDVRLELAQTALDPHRRDHAAIKSAHARPRSTRQHAARPPRRRRASPARRTARPAQHAGWRPLPVLRPRRRPAGGRNAGSHPRRRRRARRVQAVMAERRLADLGAGGLGRLDDSGPGRDAVTSSEDVAGSPFGFKLASVTSNLTNAMVTGPAGAAAGDHGRFHRRQPQRRRDHHGRAHPARRIDRERHADRATNSPPAEEFTIGATPATRDNMQAAPRPRCGKLAGTSLSAASAIAAARLLQYRRPATAEARGRAAVRHRDGMVAGTAATR